jgi:site-specific recombinase XerD
MKTAIDNPSNQFFVSDLIDHYLVTELSEQTNWHSHSTRIGCRVFLNRWIRPRWGSTNIRDVRTIAVESWLRQLQRKDGEALANSSKAKIRNVMSVLFNHAIRYEWLEQGKNPIKPVRQSTLRQRSPTSFRTARTSELTVTTGIALPTHDVAGRHHWIASQRTICVEVE